MVDGDCCVNVYERILPMLFLKHALLILLAMALPLCAYDTCIQINNGVPQICVDGKPVRPRWSCSRDLWANYPHLEHAPTTAIPLLPETTELDVDFVATQDAQEEISFYFCLQEYVKNRAEVNLFLDDFSVVDVTDNVTVIPLNDFNGGDGFGCYPVDKEDFAIEYVPNGGKDDSPCLKVTRRNVVSCAEAENDQCKVFSQPCKVDVKAGHIYRFHAWVRCTESTRMNLRCYSEPNGRTDLILRYDPMQEQIVLAADADVDFVTTLVNTPWPKDGEERDFRMVDSALQRALDVNPDAKLVPRVIIKAPEWWLQEHPDELIGWVKPARVFESYCSPVWRKEALEQTRAMILHIEEKFGKSIAGYHIGPGIGDEWFYGEAFPTVECGYSPAETAAFRRWLARKYGTDAALQEAWRNPAVTLATAVVPSPKERDAMPSHGIFLEPSRAQSLVDFNLMLQDETADCVCEFAHLVRELCGRTRLTVFFYGYTLELSGGNLIAQAGNCGLAKVIANDDVDILCSPISYFDRLAGGGGYSMAMFESVTNAGKLWFMEDDSRTHMAASGHLCSLPDHEHSRMNSQQMVLRNNGQQLVRNLGCWWMDLGTWHWFSDPALWEVMRTMKRADDLKLQNPKPYLPPVAVVCDELAYCHTADALTSQAPLMSAARRPIAHMGAAFGQYLLSDVLTNGVDNAQLMIYLNAWALDAAQRDRIRAVNAGKGVVWCYAPGLLDTDNGVDVENTRDLTGFSVKIMDGSFQKVLGTAAGRAIGLPGEWMMDGEVKMVLAVSAEKGDVVWATWPDGSPAIVQRGNQIFNGTTTLNWPLMRAAEKAAGVHLYTDRECVFYTDGSFAVVHAIQDGPVTVTLPRRVNQLLDATNMMILAEYTDAITLNLHFGETRLLYWR